MTIEEYNNNIWMFYLQLEDDFCAILNYVEFSDDNFKTYSKEFTKQLLSIGSEIDITFKELCKYVDSSKKRDCITDYAKILYNYDNLTRTEVKYNFTKENFAPFVGWTESNSPFWWKAYNCIKHNRLKNENRKKGNLKNVFYALAGLFILNRYLCKFVCDGKIMQEPEIHSKVFEIVGWSKVTTLGNGFLQVMGPNGNMSIMHES